MPRRGGWPVAIALILGLLLVNYVASQSALRSSSRIQIPYRPTFLQQVQNGNVRDMSSEGSQIQADLSQPITYHGQTSTEIGTVVPTFANLNQLSGQLAAHDVTVNAKPVSNGPPAWLSVLVGFGPTILLVLVFLWLFRRASGQGGASGLMGFGRSRARRVEGRRQNVTFADVAGIDEAKQELAEIVEFLRDPRRFTRLGGRMPRGVLLLGRPGTGKTLLARAVAGEAGVAFFQVAASEFVEMIVGVGAARVRDLFQKAKQAAPAIIFIDELDAIGRSRAGGAANVSGGHDEREQTLNQILTEMDGFDPRVGIVMIAATNRGEILDPAPLRPGRFDRQVPVSPPDRRGREQILRVHTRTLPLGDDVDLDLVAVQTGNGGRRPGEPDQRGGDRGSRRGHDRVCMRDFNDALERIMLGAERRMLLSPEDRRRIAYHEAGHALAGMLIPLADPVRKVSIIPHGQALGVTLAAPDADMFNHRKGYLLAKLRVAVAGRVAEELVFDDITTGAESDIEQLTQIARQMVGRWGMSPRIGLVSAINADGHGPLLPGSPEASPYTQREVDREVRRLADEAHSDVAALLIENRARLDGLASALLEHETLDAPEAYAAAGLQWPEPSSGSNHRGPTRSGAARGVRKPRPAPARGR